MQYNIEVISQRRKHAREGYLYTENTGTDAVSFLRNH